MSTYTQILYQIIFSTKNRSRSLIKERRKKLYKYISGILKNKKCHLHRINGVEDHIHILTSLHPTMTLSSLVKNIKLGSAHFIKKKQLFPDFDGWQEGYAAFTYSNHDKEGLIQYLINQETHHKTVSFKDELTLFLKEYDIDFDERYLV